MEPKTRKERQPAQVSVEEQAVRLHRPLQWMNALLDALIEILESQHSAVVPSSLGTLRLLDLLEEYKRRAIREGFRGWFPEGETSFWNWFLRLEAIDRALDEAGRLAGDREQCQAKLADAKRWKKLLVEFFPEFLGVSFSAWYENLYWIDHVIERLEAELAAPAGNITQEHLISEVEFLRDVIELLADIGTTPGDVGGASPYLEMNIDLDFQQQEVRFLLDQVRQNDWDVTQQADRERILETLRRLRSRKHNITELLGDYGGKSVLDLYKALFEIDFHIQNAADLWDEGQLLPEWDAAKAREIIARAEQAKIRFIDLLPSFLDQSLGWWFKQFYHMDLQLNLAKDLLELGHLGNALAALHAVRGHKHDIEEYLDFVLSD